MKLLTVLSLGWGCSLSALFAAESILADQLPPAVWKTIQSRSDGRQPSSIQKEDAEGTVIYEVVFSVGGDQERTLTVGGDGTLLSVEIALTEAPAAVQKTIAAQLGGGSLDGIERASEGGETTYDVDFTTKGGEERSLSVAEDGTLLSLQVGLEETPPGVQTTIKNQIAEGKISQIDKTFDESTVTYDVSFSLKAGTEQSFTVADDGRLMSMEITLDQSTPAAQKTIKNRLGSGRILRVSAVFGEGKKVTAYEVEGMADGKPTGFKVGPKGKFLGGLD
jgi:uncharacterized membrane protein YkoI